MLLHTWFNCTWMLLVGLLVAAAPAAAQEEREPPPYPRVNLSRGYVVDAAWPHKPADYAWEAMPGVAVDAEDNIWVFTRSQPPIQVYRPNGALVRAWGEKTIKTAHHIKIDHEGFVWVADIGLHVVRKFTPGGDIVLTLGTPGELGCDESRLNMPTDMTITPAGDVFVSDGYGNNRVVHFDARGKFVKAWGELGAAPEQFSLPHAIAHDSQGRLYVADRNNVRVQVYSQEGKLLASWKDVIVPWGFCVTKDDAIWVCGSSPMRWETHPDYPGAPLGCPPKDQLVMKFDTQGKILALWTFPKAVDGKEQPGELNWVHALALDSRGNLYLGDIIGKRAQKFVPGPERQDN